MSQRNIWVGDLDPHSDETYLMNIFAVVGEIESVRVMRNKESNLCQGYGFVTFRSHDAAVRALALNGLPIPATNKLYRLNWGSGGQAISTPPIAAESAIYVGNLDSTVTDDQLLTLFKGRYPSTRSAVVITDKGQSKGFGFVRLSDPAQATKAIQEMNQALYCGRSLKVSASASRNQSSFSTPPQVAPSHRPQSHYAPPPTHQHQHRTPQSFHEPPRKRVHVSEDAMDAGLSIAADPANSNNTTVFVGNLPSSVNESSLRDVFSRYGTLISAKVYSHKNIAFVQYQDHQQAALAIVGMHLKVFWGNSIRLGWGKQPNSSAIKEDRKYSSEFQQPIVQHHPVITHPVVEVPPPQPVQIPPVQTPAVVAAPPCPNEIYARGILATSAYSRLGLAV
ncbi:hypothetical protein RCL1_005515 [Eukaryota sp. TZLM3-RCL]